MTQTATATGNRHGIILMIAAMAGFILNDTLTKLASEALPTGQIIFVRGLLATPMIVLLAWWFGALANLASLRHRSVAWRTVGEMGSTALYLTALFHMPLANATAILQIVPLITTAAAAIFLRERVGPRRWSAVLLGLIGVILIVRPGLEGFNAWSLVALSAMAFIALRDLSSRLLPPEVPTLGVTLVASVAVTALGAGLGLAEQWQPLSPRLLGLLAIAALFLTAGYALIIQAMRAGEISAVGPFRYTIMLWAIILQFAVFGSWPDWLTLAGTAIVVATGIYTFYRERRAPPMPEPALLARFVPPR
jgi:drug/metabolite transporter (DMT)-like permease